MDVLKGEIRPLWLVDEYVDETGYADGDGVDDGSNFDTFSPNTSSPLSNPSSPIECGNTMGELNPIPGYYTSEETYTPSLPPNAAAIEPSLDTNVNLYDTEFLMPTLTPLTKIRAVDQDAEAIDNSISPPSWNDIHWDAFVDSGTSIPTDDVNMIFRNATSPDAQRLVQMPDAPQLDHTLLNQKSECDNFFTTASSNSTSVIGDSSAGSQHHISAPDPTQLSNTSVNWEPE